MEKNSVIAVDIAKSVFDLAGSDEPGRVTFRRRLSRGAFLTYLAQVPASTVVMEACGSAHYWAREIEDLGHTIVLLPPWAPPQAAPQGQGLCPCTPPTTQPLDGGVQILIVGRLGTALILLA